MKFTDNLVETLLARWQTATLTDYASTVLAVVILGWVLSQYTSKNHV